jgi:hypothetical protein
MHVPRRQRLVLFLKVLMNGALQKTISELRHLLIAGASAAKFQEHTWHSGAILLS